MKIHSCLIPLIIFYCELIKFTRFYLLFFKMIWSPQKQKEIHYIVKLFFSICDAIAQIHDIFQIIIIISYFSHFWIILKQLSSYFHELLSIIEHRLSSQYISNNFSFHIT